MRPGILAFLLSAVLAASIPTAHAGGTVFSAGLFAGFRSPTHEAVDGYPDTKTEGGLISGGTFFFGRTLGAELMFERIECDLTERSVTFGKLTAVPLILRFKYQTYPGPRSNGPGFHAHLGFGAIFGRLSKGSYFLEQERNLGVNWRLKTTAGPAMSLGLGGDFWFSPVFSMFVDFEGLIGDVRADWQVSGGVSPEAANVDRIGLTSFQFLAGIRVWVNRPQ